MRRKKMNARKIIAMMGALITGGIGIVSTAAQSAEAAMSFN